MVNVRFTIQSNQKFIRQLIEEFVQIKNDSDSPFRWSCAGAESEPESSEKKTVDFFVLPLQKLDANKKTHHIVSVTKRLSGLDRLLLPPQFFKKNIPGALRTLPLATTEERIQDQFVQLIPEADVPAILPENEVLDELLKSGDRALIAPWHLPVNRLLEEGWNSLVLHPSEFTPEAGSGCWAIARKEEVPDDLIQTVRELHHPSTVVLTNIERKFVREFNKPDWKPLGVFLQSPAEDKYELYLCLKHGKTGSVEYIDYPSSTIGDMVPEALKMVDIHIEQNSI